MPPMLRAARTNKEMDKEGERLGLPVPFAILPNDHPMWVRGQELLDAENAALRDMRAAANAMFDWALDETLGRCGTPEQKRNIREQFETIKKMAHVQKIWIDAVTIALRLAA